MVRSFLPRFSLFRSIVPRISAPLLPISRSQLRPSPLTNTPRSSHATRLFHNFPARLNAAEPTPDPRHSLPPDATLSQRLKHLIKSYGWYALGIYLIVGVVDLGVAFAGVNLLGAEYASRLATSVKETAVGFIYSKPPEPGKDEIDAVQSPGAAQAGHEGFYAMLVIAYTIHKLLLPLRVGLTAAITPRLVGWLSQRGWAGGAGTKRAAAEMRERIRDRRNRNSHD